LASPKSILSKRPFRTDNMSGPAAAGGCGPAGASRAACQYALGSLRETTGSVAFRRAHARFPGAGQISGSASSTSALSAVAAVSRLGSDVNDVTLPLSPAAQPFWLVPANTNQLVVAAQGTVPITMDVSWISGDPDFAGQSRRCRSTAPRFARRLARSLLTESESS
jgi:hypothetical protein